MPSLLNLKTDLKSLRFGAPGIPGDKQGGGWSNQPYIVTPIPEGDTTGASELYGDFILRGGALRPTLVARNRSRLVQFLGDLSTGNGIAFVAKQNILARLNPPSIGQPNRIYTPANTIAQTADPTGILHFNKDGTNPITPFNQTYEKRTELQNETFTKQNRLIMLSRSKLADVTSAISLQYGIIPVPGNILTYNGGAGSVGGIGVTTIKRKTVTDQNSNFIQLGNGIAGFRTNTTTPNLTLTSTTLSNLNYGEGLLRIFSGGEAGETRIYKDEASTILSDFRETVKKNNSQATKLVSSNYTVFNRTKTYRITDSGNRSFTRINQYEGARDSSNQNRLVSDPVTMKPIYKSTNVETDMENNDFIKFWIARLNNDSTDGQKEYIHLRAYLSGISDNFQASFNNFNYVGRAETFKTYNGFDRNLSFTLKVAALSRVELKLITEKINYIASLTAPDYSDAGFMRSNIVYLTLGDYLDNVPGFINSVNITIPDDTSWEIARGADGELAIGETLQSANSNDLNNEFVQQLPKYAEMQISFSPIHSMLPQVGARFIGKGFRYQSVEIGEETTSPTPPPRPLNQEDQNQLDAEIRGQRLGIFN